MQVRYQSVSGSADVLVADALAKLPARQRSVAGATPRKQAIVE